MQVEGLLVRVQVRASSEAHKGVVMASAEQQTFSLRVQQATMLPDEAAVREFWKQFKDALETDSDLKARFDADPSSVLSERGLASDIQRELLLAVGVAGAAEAGCGGITCVFTEIHAE